MARFFKALGLAFGIELIAASIWFASGPYSSVPSVAGSIGWALHSPGILLLLSFPWFSGASDLVLYLVPPLTSFLLWLFLWLVVLTGIERYRTRASASERKA